MARSAATARMRITVGMVISADRTRTAGPANTYRPCVPRRSLSAATVR